MTQEELLRTIEDAARDGLASLDLSGMRLTALPPKIGQLTNLRQLWLNGNQLRTLPPEIGQLTNLHLLYLNGNQLRTLPPEIGQFTNLWMFDLGNNRLNTLPREIGQLTNLQQLWLGNNRLNTLPREIGQLTNLQDLWLTNNQLRTLPPEIGQLANLRVLSLEGNPLTAPPEIVEQGTKAILTYTRERLERSSRLFISKLLVVGEGGVGKTCLLRALRGERFVEQPTTHGIQIDSLDLPHPTEAGIAMLLSTWDFGGQEIYHATHQFFLTNRSLFLLTWNARHGFEQGKLYYWLDTIQALAPDSPVLLVAAHIDERDADIPLTELRRQYPQIIGQCEISNTAGTGMEALRREIIAAAAGLPLMGEAWPATWLEAANAIRALSEKHIAPQRLWAVMAALDVAEAGRPVLAQWLHELGDILYFRDSDELNDTVILKPQWVTEYISRALESEEVIAQAGIFRREHMELLWHDLEPAMRDHFMRLMERFDLSYRTLENKEISLVVERLPLDEPDYQPQWNVPQTGGDCCEISMTFQVNTLPAGIPTWFIARSHRFTTHTHWRHGALFADSTQRRHLALVRAAPHEGVVQLTVRGPHPQNFFALLKDGIEVTLARFPGLKITRLIPCPGHDGQPCSQMFDYKDLLRRVKKKPLIECPKSLEDVSVPGLLFGLHWSTQDVVLQRLDKIEDAGEERDRQLLDEMKNLRALTQRGFTDAFRREQEKPETYCPNVFVLRPREGGGWRKSLMGQRLELQLYCQAPSCWHPTEQGGRYEIDDPASWLRAVAPYLRRLVDILKYAAPLAGPWLTWMNEETYKELFKNDVDAMKSLIEKLPELEDDDAVALAAEIGRHSEPEHMEGAALRALRALLDEKDSSHQWGGLERTLTPEGHYLWLCDYHRAEYKR